MKLCCEAFRSFNLIVIFKARKKRHVAISIADLKARRDADPDHFTLSIQELVDIFEYLGFKDAQHWSGTEPKDIADLVNEATLEDGYQNDDLASQFVRQLAEYNSFMTCEPTNPRGTILVRAYLVFRGACFRCRFFRWPFLTVFWHTGKRLGANSPQSANIHKLETMA